jgi:small subunit ribosomal protein S6
VAKPPQIYDLMVILRSDVDDDRRDAILDQIQSTIESGGGSVESQHDWGIRGMTFEIDHQGEGEYFLYQFSGPREMLEELGRSLRIADGVLRFRIIKVLPGTPPPPEVRLEPAPAEY